MNVLIEESTMKSIADAIRAKTGKEDLMLPSAMENEVSGIETGDKWEEILYKLIDRSIEEIDISDFEITEINKTAFHSCTKLKTISFPPGITKLEMQAFYNCNSLSITSLPDNITVIDSYAFARCASLALTSLPDNLTLINQCAFSGCVKLELTFLPKSLARIGIETFSNCKSLTTITFLGRTDKIDKNAFINCPNLTEINVPWSEGAVANAPWGATNATINYDYVVPEV